MMIYSSNYYRGPRASVQLLGTDFHFSRMLIRYPISWLQMHAFAADKSNFRRYTKPFCDVASFLNS